MPMPRVAILGLGIMGAGMAGRVVGAGFATSVFNRSPDRAKRLVELGARFCRTPREAAADADVVIGMVADDAASRAVWTGESGALAGTKRGAVLIESSTLSVGWVRELASLAAAVACEFLDAPVTGTKPHAAAGELTFLVGGSDSALAKARPVLQVMSKAIVHLGPTSSGAMVKLINNFLAGVQLTSVAEAITMIERSGLDRPKTIEVLAGGAAGSPVVRTMLARMAARDYQPNFLMRLMAKDLNYAIKEGASLEVDVTSAKSALALLNRAIDANLGEKDMSAVAELVRASGQ